ncbi:hypothetical protein G5714_004746 [Onychostoma macrolepis]|uniref:Uncharacterized protein n=1 Tax=Onychostoma macrolepis TaxID=369639 RepID=A0A7J6D5I9_9TELE|nr:hypothetical protein G5714_004746 [Onychostoma macrolepis]
MEKAAEAAAATQPQAWHFFHEEESSKDICFTSPFAIRSPSTALTCICICTYTVCATAADVETTLTVPASPRLILLGASLASIPKKAQRPPGKRLSRKILHSECTCLRTIEEPNRLSVGLHIGVPVGIPQETTCSQVVMVKWV